MKSFIFLTFVFVSTNGQNAQIAIPESDPFCEAYDVVGEDETWLDCYNIVDTEELLSVLTPLMRLELN